MSVFESVKSIIAKNLKVSEEKITLDANLKEDLGADSIDAVEIIMDLEDEFNISIAADETEDIKTVKDLVSYIEKSQK